MKKAISFVLIFTVLLTMAFSISAFAEEPIGVSAEKITVVPTLDGSVTESEWGKPFFEGNPKNSDKFYIAETTRAAAIPENIKFYVRWDDKNLYVAAVVTHKVYFNNLNGSQIWQGDSLELDIAGSAENQKWRWRTNTGLATTDNGVYSFVYGTPNAAGNGVEGTELPWVDNSVLYGRSAVTLNGKTVTYELAFPWEYYGRYFKVKEGLKIAINFELHVADGTLEARDFGGGEVQSPYAGSVAYGSKSYYPVVELIAEKNPPKATNTSSATSSNKVSTTSSEFAPPTISLNTTSSKTSTTTSTTSEITSQITDAPVEQSAGLPAFVFIIIGATALILAGAAVFVVITIKRK